jgi:phosphoserine aminotransferase
MEMSHRGKFFTEIAENARDKLRKLLEIPDDFQIFFFQGGASMQFAAIPLNLLGNEGGASNYLTSGSWSEGALKEAKKYSTTTEVANNTKDKFWTIDEPSTWKINPEAKYFHYCDNETI